MSRFSVNPKEMITSAWRNRALIVSLSHREVVGRYKGSVLGIFWSLVLPVFMLTVYTFVFSVVFKARWNAESTSKTEFALILFAGLLVFNLFSECVNRAPTLILYNQNYVKKVLFPLEILPLISLCAALFHTLISYLVWQIFYIAFFGFPHLTVLLVPVVLAPLVLFTLGVSWMLAALAVYLRDIAQLVGVLTTVLMFMSPIFYPLSALPAAYRPILGLNPLAFPIEFARDVMLWGKLPDAADFALYTVGCLFMAWAGFACFQKLRSGFADVV
jgi:lipopolysaccharide transport system permease protein